MDKQFLGKILARIFHDIRCYWSPKTEAVAVQGGPTNLTQEIEVSCMLFERFLPMLSMSSLEQHKEYFILTWLVQFRLISRG